MEDKQILLENIGKIRTTDMGAARIKKNLKTDMKDAAEYCKDKVSGRNCSIYRRGKNWYCVTDNVKFTINARTYTIITAHVIK